MPSAPLAVFFGGFPSARADSSRLVLRGCLLPAFHGESLRSRSPMHFETGGGGVRHQPLNRSESAQRSSALRVRHCCSKQESSSHGA
ncbi:hypothetical protein NDU88_010905 [Pleurodeles waltl]|uniref:Secreted protein n=1 Tax=Pleurodeles waltl TaxID=8319 RepID=A0AAV7QYL8_PLEWA|nr:hypothetical protein NDU88_010905 [Pleurodeles waltl]